MALSAAPMDYRKVQTKQLESSQFAQKVCFHLIVQDEVSAGDNYKKKVMSYALSYVLRNKVIKRAVTVSG